MSDDPQPSAELPTVAGADTHARDDGLDQFPDHGPLEAAGEIGVAAPMPPDLDVIEADLADVEVALERLDSGEYWRDETTGESIDDAVLEARPTARRNPT